MMEAGRTERGWLGLKRRRGRGAERLILEGTSPETLRLAMELHERRHELGIEIVGFVDRDPKRVGERLFNPTIIGTAGDIPSLVSRFGARRVLISTPSVLDEMPLSRILRLRFAGVSFEHLAGVYEQATGKVPLDGLSPAAAMFSPGFGHRLWLQSGKRVMDVLLSLAGMALAAPVMLATNTAIALSSDGPIFYRQRRVGRGGRVFTLPKLRSMRPDAEQETGPTWAGERDIRVTTIGRFLRRTHLDELPQLWTVLRGEMSLVGPRPERPELQARLVDEEPLYTHRQLVRPGITGWAQIQHRYCGSAADARVRLQYDLFYIKRASLLFDCLIVLKTAKHVLRGFWAKRTN
jgi:exopolysaccharide biosynthesis polyprenyl glycosylphosphotransferase